MTEREIRLCIAGTVSEAQLQLSKIGYARGAGEDMAKWLEAAIDELTRAKMYAESLAKVKVENT